VSKIGQLRSAWHYETNVPRCETCISVRKPYVYLKTDSIPAQSKWHCKAGNFDVRPNACCDKWRNKKGEVVA
jgi:hypothetical protein